VDLLNYTKVDVSHLNGCNLIRSVDLRG